MAKKKQDSLPSTADKSSASMPMALSEIPTFVTHPQFGATDDFSERCKSLTSMLEPSGGFAWIDTWIDHELDAGSPTQEAMKHWRAQLLEAFREGNHPLFFARLQALYLVYMFGQKSKNHRTKQKNISEKPRRTDITLDAVKTAIDDWRGTLTIRKGKFPTQVYLQTKFAAEGKKKADADIIRPLLAKCKSENH